MYVIRRKGSSPSIYYAEKGVGRGNFAVVTNIDSATLYPSEVSASAVVGFYFDRVEVEVVPLASIKKPPPALEEKSEEEGGEKGEEGEGFLTEPERKKEEE